MTETGIVEGVAIVENGKLVFISSIFSQTLGYSRLEFEEMVINDIYEIVHPEDLSSLKSKVTKAIDSATQEIEIHIRCRRKDGVYIPRSDKLRFFIDEKAKLQTIIIHSNFSDFFKTQSVESILSQENKVLKAVSDINQNLFKYGNIEKVIELALKEVGSALNVDRAYYFTIDHNRKTISQKAEWVNSEISPQLQNEKLQELSFGPIWSFLKTLIAQQKFEQIVDELPEGYLKKILQSQQIKSILVLPIVVDGKSTGYIGFDDCKYARNWSLFEYNALNSLVSSLSRGFNDLAYKERIKASKQKLYTILEKLDDIVFTVNIKSNNVEFTNAFGLIDYLSESDNSIGSLDNLIKYIDPSSLTQFRRFLRKLNNKEYGQVQLKSLRETSFKWVSCSAKIIRDFGEGEGVVLVVLRDITNEKEAIIKMEEAFSDAEEANRAKSELELRSLQMQMNPHFIFNSLNSIQSYVVGNEPLKANLFLSKFSNLMRLYLESSRDKYITLKDELRLLQLYIEIEKLRFENKFDFSLNVSEEIDLSIEIPTMVLQPFVENSINHGLRYKEGKGELVIDFFKKGDYLSIEIKDNGVGLKKGKKIKEQSSHGYKSQGIEITKERMKTYNLYNLRQMNYEIRDLKPDSKGDIGVSVRVDLPIYLD